MTKLGLQAKKEIELQEHNIIGNLKWINHELEHDYIDSDDAWLKVQDLSDSDAWFEDIDKVMKNNHISYSSDQDTYITNNGSDIKDNIHEGIQELIQMLK